MPKRLQILLDNEELLDIQRHARRQRMTTAEWVRRSIRAAREAESGADLGQKLASIRAAAKYEFPTADIEVMLGEIERGYGVRKS